MKTIALINPASRDYSMQLFPPLNLITIASHLPGKYDLRLIDENFNKVDYDNDLAFITANTYTIKRAYEIADECRRLGKKVVIGGIHASHNPLEAGKHADSIVIGNGEPVMKELMKDYESGKLKKEYKAPLMNLNKALPPRRDLLGKHYLFDSIETVRGCPFNCEFCTVTPFNGFKYRYKPLSIVKKELNSIKKGTIFITDDNVLGSGEKASKRALQLMNLLKNYNYHWMAQASMNAASNERFLKQANESGAVFFFMGLETIHKESLKEFNKTVNLRLGVNHYKEAIRKIHSHGINVMGSFIIGTDYDTAESLKSLKEFIKESGVDIPIINVLTPYPGSRTYERIVKDKRLFWNDYWMKEQFPIYTFKPKRMTIKELHNATKEIIWDVHSKLQMSKRFLRTISRKQVRNAFYSIGEDYVNTKSIKKRLIEYEKVYLKVNE